MTHVMLETLLLTLLGGFLGLAVGASGIRLLNVLGADRLPLGHTLRSMAAWRRLGLLARFCWVRHRRADRVVQPAQRSRACAPNDIPNRHGQQGSSTPAPWFCCRADRARVCSACECRATWVSLRNAMTVSPGFRADHVITGQFTLPYAPFPAGSSQRIGVLDRLLEAIGQQPGVAAAGTVTNVPLSGDEGQISDHARGVCAAARRIAAWPLFLRHHRRLLFGPRHSAARRTVPYISRFSPR